MTEVPAQPLDENVKANYGAVGPENSQNQSTMNTIPEFNSSAVSPVKVAVDKSPTKTTKLLPATPPKLTTDKIRH